MSKGSWDRKSSATSAIALVMAAVVLVGCRSGGSNSAAGNEAAPSDVAVQVKPENRFKVAADPTAAFFRFSPQQAAGPDEHVKKETRVELVNRLAGYSRVKLPSGTVGYMDTADLVHLSPKEIADEDALVAAQQAAAAAAAMPPVDPTGGNIGNGGNYRPPSEAGRAEPLPIADPGPTPTPPPSTMFRY